jgi:hypothetical protein
LGIRIFRYARRSSLNLHERRNLEEEKQHWTKIPVQQVLLTALGSRSHWESQMWDVTRPNRPF